ncbi:MAG: hypothetical protein AAFQ83_07080 [Bacteroidota bacterium]
MKSLFQTVTLLAIMILLTFLASCSLFEQVEPEDPCKPTRDAFYPDLTYSRFKIADLDSMYLNTYLESTYKLDKPFIFESQGQAEAYINLNFVRINLTDSCEAFRAHGFSIYASIDQLPFEEKTYALEAPGGRNYASYNFGEYLGGSLALFTGPNAGSITITNYTPDARLAGYYQFEIGDFVVGGRFDYEL